MTALFVVSRAIEDYQAAHGGKSPKQTMVSKEVHALLLSELEMYSRIGNIPSVKDIKVRGVSVIADPELPMYWFKS